MRLLTIAAAVVIAAFASPILAETRTITDDLGRQVEIPVDPQAIASLDDLRLTLPLIELGAPVVASHGRISRVDSSQYIRSADILTGASFENSNIAFIGIEPVDLEALAAAEPDLIFTLVTSNADADQLQAIAPTVVFDEDITDRFAIYDRLAEMTGTEPRLWVLKDRYAKQLAQLTRLVDTESISIGLIEGGSDGAIAIEHTFGSLGRVVRDAGFIQPDVIEEIAPGGRAALSAELLPLLDSDIMFDTYRGDRAEGPENAHARMEEVFPGYCEALTACTEGNYYRIPRDEAKAISYNALSAMTMMLLTILSAPAPVGE